MLKKELQQRLEVMASNCRLLDKKYNELKEFYEAKTIYVQSLQAENEMNNRVVEKLITKNRKLEERLSVNKTYCDRIETDNKLLQKELVITTKRHREIISKQQAQIEDLKDTVSQLLDMIDEIRETGEINW